MPVMVCTFSGADHIRYYGGGIFPLRRGAVRRATSHSGGGKSIRGKVPPVPLSEGGLSGEITAR